MRLVCVLQCAFANVLLWLKSACPGEWDFRPDEEPSIIIIPSTVFMVSEPANMENLKLSVVYMSTCMHA